MNTLPSIVSNAAVDAAHFPPILLLLKVLLLLCCLILLLLICFPADSAAAAAVALPSISSALFFPIPLSLLLPHFFFSFL
jgi:hypothetical protein